jgi:SagB-type dehydrogenase family enzyme
MTQKVQAKIVLPPPEITGGRPLMELLKERQSKREFSDEPLSLQILSNLLWAATGVNRPDIAKLTAPNARDRHEIDVYVIMVEGAYQYDIQNHTLEQVLSDDIRSLAGTQDFVAIAPINLVYVADYTKMPELNMEQQLIYSLTDVGFVVQNVYLFCGSADLSTVVRGSIDRAALGAALRLSNQQRIILGQSVGYPAATA